MTDRERLVAYLRTSALISIEIEVDSIPFKGNVCASGDDAWDKQQESEVRARLLRGDTWAWCTVTVHATCDDYTGSDVLGGCSYKNEKQFRESGYFADMVSVAIDHLADEILQHRERVTEILDAAKAQE